MSRTHIVFIILMDLHIVEKVVAICLLTCWGGFRSTCVFVVVVCMSVCMRVCTLLTARKQNSSDMIPMDNMNDVCRRWYSKSQGW